nr:hypothetical protein CFP56_00024 [Quercus suber]
MEDNYSTIGDSQAQGDLDRTLVDGLAESDINELRQLSEELQQLGLEILSLLAETSISMENFLKTTKNKELSRS